MIDGVPFAAAFSVKSYFFLFFLFFITMDVWANLCASRLIPRDPEVNNRVNLRL